MASGRRGRLRRRRRRRPRRPCPASTSRGACRRRQSASRSGRRRRRPRTLQAPDAASHPMRPRTPRWRGARGRGHRARGLRPRPRPAGRLTEPRPGHAPGRRAAPRRTAGILRMELAGLEPATSWVRCRLSSACFQDFRESRPCRTCPGVTRTLRDFCGVPSRERARVMKFPPGRVVQRKRYERLKAVARDLMADDLRRPLGTHRDRWNGWDDSPAARRRPRWPGSGTADLAACLAHPPLCPERADSHLHLRNSGVDACQRAVGVT
jgi:hypothetical protein